MKRTPWLVACGLAGFGAARLAAADRWQPAETPAAPLLAFTPYVAAAALCGSLALRPKGAAAAAALTGIALTTVVLPRAVRRPQPPAQGPVLRVMTANLMAGRASEDEVVRVALENAADVVFLQELTEGSVTRLKQAGLPDMLPYQLTETKGETPRGSGIYARFPLADGLALPPITAAQPTARMELPGGSRVDLVCVHAQPPNPPTSRAKAARWRRELGVLPPPAWPAADPPRVLAGDFNATPDHAHFRTLLRQGHTDAAMQLGLGLVPTWGVRLWPALLTLDHVLVDPRCAVLAVSVHGLPGSDHQAVFAEFRLPSVE